MSLSRSIQSFFSAEAKAKRAEARAKRAADRQWDREHPPARGPMMLEQLEPRMLLSAVVPSGFEIFRSGVEVTSANAPAAILVAAGDVGQGDEFYIKTNEDASKYGGRPVGTFQLGKSGGVRYADAEYYQERSGEDDVSKWLVGNLGKPLQVTGIDPATGWGPVQSDHVYGQTITSTAGTAITAKIIDPNYSDNAGSLYLDVYKKVVVESLTASDENSSSGNTAVAGGTSLPIIANSSGNFNIAFNTIVDPATFNGYAATMWEVRDVTGDVVISGDFSYDSANPTAGGSATATFSAGLGTTFVLVAGVDDGSGSIAAGTSVQIPLQAAQLNLGLVDVAVFQTNPPTIHLGVYPIQIAANQQQDVGLANVGGGTHFAPVLSEIQLGPVLAYNVPGLQNGVSVGLVANANPALNYHYVRVNGINATVGRIYYVDIDDIDPNIDGDQVPVRLEIEIV